MSAGLWAAVAAAGGVGATARYLVDLGVTALWRRRGGSLPVGTMVVNVTGAVALGFVASMTLFTPLGRSAATVVAVGLIGSYTTFSTWMAQVYELVVARRHRGAAVTLVLPLLAGLAAVALGRLVAGG